MQRKKMYLWICPRAGDGCFRRTGQSCQALRGTCCFHKRPIPAILEDSQTANSTVSCAWLLPHRHSAAEDHGALKRAAVTAEEYSPARDRFVLLLQSKLVLSTRFGEEYLRPTRISIFRLMTACLPKAGNPTMDPM